MSLHTFGYLGYISVVDFDEGVGAGRAGDLGSSQSLDLERQGQADPWSQRVRWLIIDSSKARDYWSVLLFIRAKV